MMLLRPLNDVVTETAVTCERAFLAQLDGSCRTPIAGLAEVDGEAIRFRGLILSPDGAEWHEVEMCGPAADSDAIGRQAADEVRGRAGPDFIDRLV